MLRRMADTDVDTITRSFILPRPLVLALGRRAAREHRSSVAQLRVFLEAALAAELAEIAREEGDHGQR